MDASENRSIEQDTFENSRFQWTAETTKLLIQEVRDNISIINKKNYMQKKVWKCIASSFHRRGYNITDEQCSTKWKNLKQKYRHVRDMNNETGRARETWEYFDIIDEFLNTRPEVSPLSIASSSQGFRMRSPLTDNMQCNDENDSAVPNTSYGVTRNVRRREKHTGSTLTEKLYKQREAHHKKNLEMQERFLTLLEKYVQKDNE
ncbi:uncharacterized protein LOC143894264 [Temnothorax americanus]|uniref:uncharacterized protein LOC143894264 n=1 Tax=Temnothorax americanus TaxID=1964332 RepID=UPI0040684FAC